MLQSPGPQRNMIITSEVWNRQPNPGRLVNILELFSTGAFGQSSCRSWTWWIHNGFSQRPQNLCFPTILWSTEQVRSTLQGTNISHLGKRKIIFKMPLKGDMLDPRRVDCCAHLSSFLLVEHIPCGCQYNGDWPMSFPYQLGSRTELPNLWPLNAQNFQSFDIWKFHTPWT